MMRLHSRPYLLRSIVLGFMAFILAGICSAADLKPKWDGLIHAFGIPPSGWESTVDEAVLKINWSAIETAKDQYSYKAIDDFLTQAAAKDCNVYIRLFCGSHVPNYLKTEAGTVHIYNNTDGVDDWVVQWWKPVVAERYRLLNQKLAERYDGTDRPNNDRLRVITMSRCMTTYAEPFIRELSSPDTRANLMAAGYTTALDKAAQIETVQIHADLWKRTRSSIALNPYQALTTAGTLSTDLNYTLQFMDDAKAILGDRLIIQNNSLRPIALLGGPTGTYGKMYDKMYQMYLGGTFIGFQTATMKRLQGGLKETIQYAIDHGASYLELPAGYQNTTTAGVTRAEEDAFDLLLEAQVPPQPSISFTRASVWTNVNTGTTQNSGYNANDQGVSNNEWRYELISSGGGLSDAAPWYKEPGTLLVWDTANKDWDIDGSGDLFFPQITSLGPASSSASGEFPKTARISWTAPSKGQVTLSGTLGMQFWKDPAAKSVDWVIARDAGGLFTVLASGTPSVVADEAASALITKTTDLTPFTALQNIALNKGDKIIWSARPTALAGTNGIRLVDNAMTIRFTPDDSSSGAKFFTSYR